jgi:hypothetical protein
VLHPPVSVRQQVKGRYLTCCPSSTAVLAKTCVSSSGWKQVTKAITAGHSYTLTLASKDDNYTGDATYTKYDDVTLS